jgi:hypothetical protein
MQFVALVIMIAATYIGLTDKVKTGIIELHLLWIAATCSAMFLLTDHAPALTIAMVCSVIAAFIWLTREMYEVCGGE